MNDYSHCPVDEKGQPHQFFSPYGCPLTTGTEYPQQPPVHQVPEPAGWLLVLVALVVLFFVRRRHD